MTREQTFEEAMIEYVERCKESIGSERDEYRPPGKGTPFPWSEPPYTEGFEASVRFDERTIRNYALSAGDDNPLFIDPEYAKTTRYGCQIVPNSALILVRGAGGQGPNRPQGYPVGDFFSGVAWEFYDVLRVGTSRVRATKKTSEFFEKAGSRGRLLFLIAENNYWDAHADLIAKCYGTLILVPMEAMGGSRAMPIDRVGEKLMYERGASQATPEHVKEYVSKMESQKTRRGADTLYWEDVEVGEKLGPLIHPPFSLLDQISSGIISGQTQGPRIYEEGDDLTHEGLDFSGAYHRNRKNFGTNGSGVHPITRWPWGQSDEHADAIIAPFRGQALPFDSGVRRTQAANRLFTDWMGDDGFIRRFQCALRKPLYYGDATYYTAEVIKKFKEIQKGDNEQGGTPGTVEYNVIGLRLEGSNQLGELQMQGTVAVYLPSRESGPVQLPIPHKANPDYVPYETFYRDWY